jgi:predicted ribosome quality control (RQC) complex YloA/Tae2 family protein
MKSRVSGLDIGQLVAELSHQLVGKRLSNIYDLSSKTLMFKFSGDAKERLLVESGIRLHLTQFERQKIQISSINIKLRKHLKNKRLAAIRQLGIDRVVDIEFGEGEFCHHVILEFYATGNIILTDNNYRIMTLMRVVEIENDGAKQMVAVGEIYDIKKAKEFEQMNPERLLNQISSLVAQLDDKESLADLNEQVTPIDLETTSVIQQETPSYKSKRAYKKKPAKESNLKTVLRAKFAGDYTPALVDHIISVSGLSGSVTDYKSEKLDDATSDNFKALLEAFKIGDEIVHRNHLQDTNGFILSKVEGGITIYDEFHPFIPITNLTTIPFKSFNECVDEFFSKLESQKFQLKAQQAENQALKKLANVRSSHSNQISSFTLAVESKKLFAEAIEFNLQLVDSVINTVRSFLASGMVVLCNDRIGMI